MRRDGECRPAASSSSPQASALGGGFIPPPLSRLGVGFWYKFVPPSKGRSAFYLYPPFAAKNHQKRRRFSKPPPQKNLRKIFGKVTMSVIYAP